MSAAAAVAPIPAANRNVEVVRVVSKADREAFIRFPWKVYAGNAAWVPPLLMERRDFLNPKKNPFFAHADVELYLARRPGTAGKPGEIVGRIAAVEDRNWNAFQKTTQAYWGMFESIDDADVTCALFEQVKVFARARKLTSMLGPMNLSTNADCGLLLDAFELPPYILMTYNPAYYVDLVEKAAGQVKAKDLIAWKIDVTQPVPERVARLAEKFRKREGLVVRPINLKDLAGEVDRLKKIYNDAWEANWGFVPMTDAEFQHMAKDMKQIVVPELALIAEIEGEPVAFALTLPDVHRALAKINGRLFPTGLLKLLWHMRKIRACRLTGLGIRKGFRKRGIDAVLYCDTLRNAQKLGYTEGEVSWTLEDNDLINRPIEMMGATRYKTYRIYEGSVG